MRLERDDAKIGLLVVLALGVFAGLLFHRGLTAALKKEAHYKVALDSAPDLAPGTEVQLQGLRVGQIDAIKLERQGVEYRFLADLGLRTDILLWPGTRAVVVSKPLGGAFIDLQLPPAELRQGALPPGSVLPSAASGSVAALVDDATHLVANLDAAVTDLRTSFKAKGAGVVVDNPKIAKVLSDLDATLVAFRKLAEEGQVLARHGDATMRTADQGLASLDRSLATVQGLLERRSGDLESIITHLDATLKASEGLVKEARAALEKAGPDADEVLKALDRNLTSTEELLEILKPVPHRVVWGKPSEAEREAARKRVEAAREEQRKAAGK